MSKTMQVEIVSAEEGIFSGPANMIYAKGDLGELGIAPNHTQLLTVLEPGAVRVVTDNEEQVFYVSGGLLEVQPYVVTVLADFAMRAADIDEAAAIQAKKQAADLLTSKKGEFDYSKATSELARAIAQLRTVEHLKSKDSLK